MKVNVPASGPVSLADGSVAAIVISGSGVSVAAAQGFLYSALAIAPIMLVVPMLQLALVFRFIFALLLNPHHEVFGFLVVFGSVVSIAGACGVAVDTNLILQWLAVPEPLAAILRARL